MAVQITVTADTASVERALTRLRRRIGNLQPVMQIVGETVASSTKLRFNKEQAPDGKAWKKSQRAIREGGTTLIDTGRLRGSIISVADDDGVDIGTLDVPYGPFHQLGTRRMPARPFLGLSDNDEDDVLRILRLALAREVRQ